ncbi:putative Neuropilin and tolloid-like protein 2 [Hypsibius exemplaris]|uniref:Neuropilin and tolloid-like protein 2 n=1 Tax=Hypsibius exemplaris TaxID=2072580 RepID=A0A1W0WN34_HYPEX|nr:putative Neuropilin and tolloid-like protein 2 [Hypsibius exemplaris]
MNANGICLSGIAVGGPKEEKEDAIRRHYCRWRWKTWRTIGPASIASVVGLRPCDMAFIATWSLLPFFTDVNGQSDPPVDVCQFTSTNVSIPDYFSPFYPEAYPNNTDCSRFITAPPDHVIELDFRGIFNIEGRDCHMLRNPFILRKPYECYCQYDFLEVRDGPYPHSPLMGRFCGRIYPPMLTSQSRYMWLRFKSDDAIQFEGFRAFYRSVPAKARRNVWNATDCHISLTGRDGLINATSIPKRYVNDAQANGVPIDCIYEIKVSNNSQISLRFSELKLVNPKDCDMDFIDIHQSSLEVTDRVRQFCAGPHNESDYIRLNSSHGFVRFMGDPTKINDNNFNAYFTSLRPAASCDEEDEFECGDGMCIAAELRCDNRPNCLNKADEADCDPGFSWKKTTLQSVIISVVVGIIIIGVLAVAIYLTCNEKQISQPRRYFTPAPLQKAVITDEFGYGCTVDEMLARSKEEQVGYFIRRVEGPIVHGQIPSSRLVTSQSSTLDWLQSHNPRNGVLPNGSSNHTNSLPLNRGRGPRRVVFGTPPPSMSAARRAHSATPSLNHTPSRNEEQEEEGQHATPISDESFYVAGDDLDLHTSLRNGVPVFMYSPHTKRRLMRVA